MSVVKISKEKAVNLLVAYDMPQASEWTLTKLNEKFAKMVSSVEDVDEIEGKENKNVYEAMAAAIESGKTIEVVDDNATEPEVKPKKVAKTEPEEKPAKAEKVKEKVKAEPEAKPKKAPAKPEPKKARVKEKAKSAKVKAEPKKRGRPPLPADQRRPAYQKMATDKFGTRIGSRVEGINKVLSKKLKSATQIATEAAFAGSPIPHLNNLLANGYVRKEDGKWALAVKEKE